MTFGGHWRRRVAVEIGRGRVNCLGRSADPGYKGDSGSSAETAPYALRQSPYSYATRVRRAGVVVSIGIG